MTFGELWQVLKAPSSLDLRRSLYETSMVGQLHCLEPDAFFLQSIPQVGNGEPEFDVPASAFDGAAEAAKITGASSYVSQTLALLEMLEAGGTPAGFAASPAFEGASGVLVFSGGKCFATGRQGMDEPPWFGVLSAHFSEPFERSAASGPLMQRLDSIR